MRLVKYRGKFAAEWVEEGERRRRSLGTDDPVAAQVAFQRFAQIKAEARRTPVTVDQAWSGYRATVEGRPAHVTMGHEWKALQQAFAGKLADGITEADCSAYTAKRRAQGRKDGTIWTELGRLRMALRWAEKTRLIERAPHIWRPAPGPPRDKHLSRDQARAVVAACSMPHLKLFVVLALTTAARAGALLGLTWDRVHFDTGLILLSDPGRDTSNKRRATVPINAWALPVLTDARASAITGYVIEWAGRPVASVKKGVSAAGDRAGVPWLTPHVFRHSAARWMAEDGVPMSEIAAYLGHTSTTITERTYARFSPTYLRKAGRSLDLG